MGHGIPAFQACLNRGILPSLSADAGTNSPSDMFSLMLAEMLEVPLRQRNTLLLAAGFAPLFPERPLHDPALSAARKGFLDLWCQADPSTPYPLPPDLSASVESAAGAGRYPITCQAGTVPPGGRRSTPSFIA